MDTRLCVNVETPELKFECFKVGANIKGWEWFLIYDKENYENDLKNGLYLAFVQSPLCPKGEYGFVGVDEFNKYTNAVGSPNECLPPVGYKWR